ncbi:MAG: hypothetical protein H6713_29480 [Myxococcales bacterium]|nr:hypothetical protein [Myxococcales bacterium]
MTEHEITIQPAALLTGIAAAAARGEAARGLAGWAAFWEQHNYKPAGAARRVVKAHLESLPAEVAPLELFLPWTNDNNAEWGAYLMVTAAHLRAATAARRFPARRRESGDLHIQSPTAVLGDLVVDGDLTITATQESVDLLVLGDLTVRGDFTVDWSKTVVLGELRVDGALLETSEWSVLVCCGDARAGTCVFSSGELYVLGRLLSPLISVSYNHGHCTLLGGAAALLFHESDHAGSYVPGGVEAPVIAVSEIELDDAPSGARALAAMHELLAPDIRAAASLPSLSGLEPDADFDEFIETHTEGLWGDLVDELVFALRSALERGEPIFDAPALARWRAAHGFA